MSTLSILLDSSSANFKSFDFAIELAKQLLTLSIGVLGISITFTKDLFKNISKSSKRLLAFSWTLYFLSILFGILHIMALTGSLIYIQNKSTIPEIQSSALMFAAFQIISFGFATLFIVVYGIKGLFKNTP